MKKILRHFVFVILPTLFITTNSLLALNIPNPEGYVTDKVGILSKQDKEILIQLSQKLEQKSKSQVATLIIPSLEGDTIENVAVKVFEKWGIGQKDKDNGVLFLVAPKEKKVRIEVGYGLEGDLPDGKTGALLDRYVLPSFKKGDLKTGIMNGHIALIYTLDPQIVKETPIQERQTDGRPLTKTEIVLLLIAGLGIIIGMIISPSFRTFIILLLLSGRDRGMSGGGGFGGGDGFGGGSSGGGGSSRGW